MNFLLDTNICLDLLNPKRPDAVLTSKWYFETIADPNHRFFLFSDAVTTLYYVLSERRKIDKSFVVQALQKMTEEIEPLAFDTHDIRHAFFLFNEKVFDDLEDLLMLQTALRHDIDILVTRDRALLKLGHFEKIKILSPKDLIEGKVL